MGAAAAPATGTSSARAPHTPRIPKPKPPHLSPAAAAAVLADPRTAAAAWTAREISRHRKRLARLRNTLYGRQVLIADGPPGGCRGGICCSHAWADDCWTEETPYPPGEDRSQKTEVGRRKTEDGRRKTEAGGEGAGAGAGAGAMRRGMERCPSCGALVPPIYLDSSGHCHDCHLEALPPEVAARMQASSSVIDNYDLRRRR